MTPSSSSPLGLHRVIDPPGVLPQAAWQLDAAPAIARDEVRIRVDRLNLDAASYRQLREAYAADPDKIRAAVLDIIATRGKMQNPVTGSGGMLTGTVEEAGPDSPLGLKPGQRIATLVSLTLTPLAITDGLAAWDGRSEQVPCEGHAILFARSIAAVLPDDLPVPLALAVLDVCGAPALTQRVVKRGSVAVIIGAAGKSGSLSAVAARQAGASKVIGVVPTEAEAALLRDPTTAQDGGAASAAGERSVFSSPDAHAVAGVPPSRRDSGRGRQGPGRVGGAGRGGRRTGRCHRSVRRRPRLRGRRDPVHKARRDGDLLLMATSFAAAALGAEGLAADVTMLVGNGYVPGHADLALNLIRSTPALRALFERRVLGGQP